jgi:serine/threonine protein kinase
MLSDDGNVKVIDFGLAKILETNGETKSFCGTPEYLSPEMVRQEGHDKTVDWWALGILIYEMTIGVTPFFSKSRMALIKNIKEEVVLFPDKTKYKIDYSDDFCDIVNKLLNKDKSGRLGANGDIDEIMEHPYFSNLNRAELLEKVLTPPYIPEINEDGSSVYIKMKTD